MFLVECPSYKLGEYKKKKEKKIGNDEKTVKNCMTYDIQFP